MNAGILTSGHSAPQMPAPLLGRPTPVPLPEQFWHPDALSWRTRVLRNGGSFRLSTLAAVSRFCFSVDAAGIRDRFYRLNLFCGDNIQACLVPLFTGPSLGGQQYGNATDANVNFVSADYRESGPFSGLTKPAGSASKVLNTGVRMNALPQVQALHLCVSVGTFAAAGFVCGASAGPALTAFASNSQSYSFQNPDASGGANRGSATCRYCVSRTSQTVGALYQNGIAYQSQTADVGVATAGSRTLAVFGVGNNDNGAIVGSACVRLNSYSFGAGMTAAQVAAHDAAIVALEAALGRQ